MLSLLTISLLVVSAPAPALKIPEGSAPRLLSAQLNNSGRPIMVLNNVQFIQVANRGIYLVDGKQIPFTYYETVYVTTPMHIYLDSDMVPVFSREG
jgi:hypothetical protein